MTQPMLSTHECVITQGNHRDTLCDTTDKTEMYVPLNVAFAKSGNIVHAAPRNLCTDPQLTVPQAAARALPTYLEPAGNVNSPIATLAVKIMESKPKLQLNH